MCDQQRLRSACAYALSDQNPCYSLEYSMTVKLAIEYHLEFLSIKGVYTGSFESTLVKMPLCWKSHVMAHMYFFIRLSIFYILHPVKLYIYINKTNQSIASQPLSIDQIFLYSLELIAHLVLFVLLLYVPGQQLWSWRDGQFT